MRYIMPAEWEPHEGTWIAWPHNKSHWPGRFEPIPDAFARMIHALQQNEKVFLLVNDETMELEAQTILQKNNVPLTNIIFFRFRTDTSWTRDCGPIFVRDEKDTLTATDWIFNAWGEKYEPWNHDDIIPQHIAAHFSFPLVEIKIVLEGGSIDVNGRGTLLTTEQCLLNKNRNPKLSKQDIENYLHTYLGARHIIWLKEGIIGDDTDGHIDDIARFTDVHTIVAAEEENVKDENFQILRHNLETLRKSRDQDGKPFKIATLPMPDPVVIEKQRVPASYLNFYIANNSVLVPTFRSDKKDALTLNTLGNLFPTRKIVAIDCFDLIWGLGTIHCSTQQQPVA